MKLPRTLHIEGSRLPVGEVDPEAVQFNKLRGEFLIIEEKVDGSGVSISLDNHLNLQIMHRGSLANGKEYRELNIWAEAHWEDLLFLLGERYVLFGEWMRNKHTIYYDQLPDYFLESDIYDQDRNVWLSTSARNNLLKGHDFIKQVPVIAAFKPSDIKEVTSLVGRSKYQSDNWQGHLKQKCHMLGFSDKKILQETDNTGLMEGLYIKHEDDLQVIGRYKYVRHEFLENILNSGSHLIDRLPIYNEVVGESQAE
jgi:RNA ligase